MKLIVICKSASAVGGVESVVDYHASVFLKYGYDVTTIALKNTKYSLYETDSYASLGNTTLSLHNSLLSPSLGLTFLMASIREYKSCNTIVLHHPSGIILLTQFIYTLLNFVSEHNPNILIYLHALPSRGLFSRFVYSALLKTMLLVTPSARIMYSSASQENTNFLSHLSNKKYLVPIPPPLSFINSSILKDEEYTPTVESICDFKNSFDFFGVYIGRLSSYKGLEYLVQSTIYLKSNSAIAILGTGPVYNKLMRQYHRLPQSQQRRLLIINSYITEAEKKTILGLADFFVLPSITSSEAYGISQVEAMWMGIPIVNNELPTGVRTITDSELLSVATSAYPSAKALANAFDNIAYKIARKFFSSVYIKDYAKRSFSPDLCETCLINAVSSNV